jgi:hypothetical protein
VIMWNVCRVHLTEEMFEDAFATSAAPATRLLGSYMHHGVISGVLDIPCRGVCCIQDSDGIINPTETLTTRGKSARGAMDSSALPPPAR